MKYCPLSNVIVIHNHVCFILSTHWLVNLFQVFIFSVHQANWKSYDWNKVTTIVEFNYHDDELMCFAHSKKARIVFNGTL